MYEAFLLRHVLTGTEQGTYKHIHQSPLLSVALVTSHKIDAKRLSNGH